MQTSSVCLRRQLPRRGKPRKGALRRALPRRGKPRKGELRRALLQRGKPRKERKTAVALDRAKRGKGWCGGWSRPLQSACADSFPEREAGKGRIAQTASPKGEAGKGRIAQSASTERKAEKGTKDSRGVGKGKAGKRLVRRLEQTSSVCLRRQLPRRGKPRKQERFRGVRA